MTMQHPPFICPQTGKPLVRIAGPFKKQLKALSGLWMVEGSDECYVERGMIPILLADEVIDSPLRNSRRDNLATVKAKR